MQLLMRCCLYTCFGLLIALLVAWSTSILATCGARGLGGNGVRRSMNETERDTLWHTFDGVDWPPCYIGNIRVYSTVDVVDLVGAPSSNSSVGDYSVNAVHQGWPLRMVEGAVIWTPATRRRDWLIEPSSADALMWFAVRPIWLGFGVDVVCWSAVVAGCSVLYGLARRAR